MNVMNCLFSFMSLAEYFSPVSYRNCGFLRKFVCVQTKKKGRSYDTSDNHTLCRG